VNQRERSRLLDVLAAFPSTRVAVVGDLILDRFVWGKVERISPEAPVPVVEVQRESIHLGGAANVAANLVALGAAAVPVGVVGSDEAGRALIRTLQQQGISGEGVVVDSGRATTVKTRVIAHHQQVCRTDWEDKRPVSGQVLQDLSLAWCRAVDESQAAVVSDYAKGVLAAGLLSHLIDYCVRKDRFVAVDPKTRDFSLYRGASLITPNKKEAERAAGMEIVSEESLEQAGRRLLDLAASRYILITRGEEGMTLFEKDRHLHIPAAAREVFDVTGAGDTVVATLTLGVAAGASIEEACILANHAAGVVVGKVGTAVPSPAEIAASLQDR
jgi:D-glycero-beta-D-manno-heptose-7-phosphate kinase